MKHLIETPVTEITLSGGEKENLIAPTGLLKNYVTRTRYKCYFCRNL